MTKPILRIYLSFSVLMVCLAVLAGCQSGRTSARFHPYFDAWVNDRGGGGETFELSSPVLSTINRRYAFEEMFFYTGAALSEKGAVVTGDASVLALTFIDEGDVSVLSIDDTKLNLRLQIEEDGTISSGLFGEPGSGVWQGFSKYTNDSHQGGIAFVMYRDKDIAFGQFHARFERHEIYGNFRAWARQR